MLERHSVGKKEERSLDCRFVRMRVGVAYTYASVVISTDLDSSLSRHEQMGHGQGEVSEDKDRLRR